MPDKLQKALEKFYVEKKFNTKGKLCVALVITQPAKKELPLDPESLVTAQGGQVLGLGKQAVQNILERHGIKRVLASEGGRTSRGSLGAMREYVAFLNDLKKIDLADLEKIEAFWIEKVNVFFSAKPFKVTLDKSKGLRSLVKDLITQAETKQKQSQGVHYVGAVLQHLVGAKLDCALGQGKLKHNSFSTSDSQSGRAGDFQIDKVAIHVTSAPTEAVIQRCKENLDNGLQPILVTTKKGVATAEGLAENIQLAARIDIFEIEQFIALNIYELAKFAEDSRATAVKDIVDRYNEIIEEFETDPSFSIEVIK